MGWDQLLAIYREVKESVGESAPPTACPNDGEPLVTSRQGVLFCPFDGWQHNG